MTLSHPSIFAAAAALLLFCSSCRNPGTPELWDSLMEPGISRTERDRREEKLVRRLEKEKRSAAASAKPSGASPVEKQ